MERHCENALKVAEFLKKHPQVEWVNYPALPDSPYKALIDRDYGGKASGLLSFGIKGGREAGAKFIDALQLFLRLVNIGVPNHWLPTPLQRPIVSLTMQNSPQQASVPTWYV